MYDSIFVMGIQKILWFNVKALSIQMTAQLLQTALAMPDAALFAAKLQSALEAESAKRLQFYTTVDENRKMEFINGTVIFHSPVMKRHNVTTGYIYTLAHIFANKHQQGFVGIEKILVSLTRNDYEPDMCFFRIETARLFTATQMQFPAPDWIVEVLSPSTAQIDRTIKFQDYAAHGVSEYWIVDPDTETVEQYILTDNPDDADNETDTEPQYTLVLKAQNGTIQGIALEGFCVPIRALFDETEHLRALTEILMQP